MGAATFRVIDVFDGDELVGLLAHLPLDHVKLCQKTLLRSKDHVEFLTIEHLNLSSIVKDFCSPILGYLNLLNLALQQVIVQKVNVNYLFMLLKCELAQEQVRCESDEDRYYPVFEPGVTLGVKEEIHKLIVCCRLLFRFFLFLVSLFLFLAFFDFLIFL